MKCQKCGTLNDDKSTFCRNCGCELVKNVTESKPKKTIKYVFFLSLIIICVIVGYNIFRIETANKKYSKYMEQAKNYKELKEYDNAIQKYQAALDVIDNREGAYIGLAEIYRDQCLFEQAYVILDQGIDKNSAPNSLDDLKDDIIIYQQEWECLNSLYNKMCAGDYEWLEDYFNNNISDQTYLSDFGDRFYFQNNQIVDMIEDGYGMIYDSENGLYLGEIRQNQREGSGSQFGIEYDGYYFTVEGVWSNNSANGYCIYYDSHYHDKDNGEYVAAEFKGEYVEGLENGDIEMTWWYKNADGTNIKNDCGTIYANQGVRETLDTKDDLKVYVIGDNSYWYMKDLTGCGLPVKKYY